MQPVAPGGFLRHVFQNVSRETVHVDPVLHAEFFDHVQDLVGRTVGKFPAQAWIVLEFDVDFFVRIILHELQKFTERGHFFAREARIFPATRVQRPDLFEGHLADEPRAVRRPVHAVVMH